MNLIILALFCADGCWSSVKDFISLFKLGPDVKIFMSYYRGIVMGIGQKFVINHWK